MMQFSSEKTKYTAKFTSRMKKDFEKIRRRGYDIAEFARVVQKLLNAEPLEERYRDHALEGKWQHHRELHIKPDWLLIYGHLEKLAFGNFFECADEFYRRYNSATKNIAFSKLPLKTEVFRGFLIR